MQGALELTEADGPAEVRFFAANLLLSKVRHGWGRLAPEACTHLATALRSARLRPSNALSRSPCPPAPGGRLFVCLLCASVSVTAGWLLALLLRQSASWPLLCWLCYVPQLCRTPLMPHAPATEHARCHYGRQYGTAIHWVTRRAHAAAVGGKPASELVKHWLCLALEPSSVIVNVCNPRPGLTSWRMTASGRRWRLAEGRPASWSCSGCAWRSARWRHSTARRRSMPWFRAACCRWVDGSAGQGSEVGPCSRTF